MEASSVRAILRLDFPWPASATAASSRALGGEIDDAPPAWADRSANFYFGHDPEGNQFGVSERRPGGDGA